jgi:hypothetical protein
MQNGINFSYYISMLRIGEHNDFLFVERECMIRLILRRSKQNYAVQQAAYSEKQRKTVLCVENGV